MANVKISALPAGSAAAGGDVPMVQAGVTNKLTLGTLAYQAASAIAVTGGTITGLTNLTIANAGTLTPATNDGAALGTTALSWSDLFLASGGVINFNNGDVTITHSANTLAFAGAATAYTFNGGPVRPSANDGAALGSAGTAWSDLFLANGGVINFGNGDVTITHPTVDALAFTGATSGYSFTGGPVFPSTDDGLALGIAGQAFSDLFLALGGVISWDSGDVTITHSANTLAFAGAATAYTFNGGPVRPSADDGAALGVSGTAWSDLFLASGGVINWNAGDVTITHSANVLAFAGASTGYTFDALLSNTAGIKAFSGTAVPAGGTTGSGVTMSSTANLGIFFGSGAPTLVAAQGSLYLRTDGSGVANRLYVATNGSGGWTNVVTAI